MNNATLGLILKEFRMAHKLLQSDIATITGKSTSAVSRYEKGEADIPATVIIDICQHFNISIDELLNISHPISGFDDTLIRLLNNASDIDIKRIKNYLEIVNTINTNISLMGYESVIDPSYNSFVAEKSAYYMGLHKLPVRGYVAAGTPIEAIDNDLKTIEVSSRIDADYALIVSGNSMYPIIEDGEYVYVKSVEELNNGDIGVFYYNGSVTCKKFFKNDVMIKLISLNPTYEDFIFHRNDSKNENIGFKIEGKVILSADQRKRLNK